MRESNGPGGIDEQQVATARGALAPLPQAYQRLFDAAVRVLGADERVRAVWLSGSLARGNADAGSDLDLLLAVSARHFDDSAAGWRERLTAITPTLIARELPGMPGSSYATTSDCLRLDIVQEPTDRLDHTPFCHRLVVFDRDGLDALLPGSPPPAGPDPEAIEQILQDAYRELAIFPAAVVARGDWLLGVVGVHLAQQHLYRLLVACNAPLPPMGVKQWSARLTPAQRDVLAGLPQPRADREQVVAGMGATFEALRTFGRRTAEQAGVPWPRRLDECVAAYFAREGLPVGAR